MFFTCAGVVDNLIVKDRRGAYDSSAVICCLPAPPRKRVKPGPRGNRGGAGARRGKRGGGKKGGRAGRVDARGAVAGGQAMERGSG